jgi:hypothetical protein
LLFFSWNLWATSSLPLFLLPVQETDSDKGFWTGSKELFGIVIVTMYMQGVCLSLFLIYELHIKIVSG